MGKINFDSLPDNGPKGLLEKAKYRATIATAEMKTSAGKPDYLNLSYDLKSLTTGKACGRMFDIITEPTHDITRYKLKRFIEALKIPITGEFELKDLSKIVKGKSFDVDITVKNDAKYGDQNVVDVFAGEVFYPIEANIDVPEQISIDEIDAIDAIDSGTESSSTDNTVY